ncbi:MAG: hypothetical protein ACD_82C00189G0001 [uncultured bacterium]|nr:MAG: hypothetical protein ACD_82C00189G0001 [uncultured bacterium]
MSYCIDLTETEISAINGGLSIPTKGLLSYIASYVATAAIIAIYSFYSCKFFKKRLNSSIAASLKKELTFELDQISQTVLCVENKKTADVLTKLIQADYQVVQFLDQKYQNQYE